MDDEWWYGYIEGRANVKLGFLTDLMDYYKIPIEQRNPTVALECLKHFNETLFKLID